jgi:hypothetical protein
LPARTQANAFLILQLSIAAGKLDRDRKNTADGTDYYRALEGF